MFFFLNRATYGLSCGANRFCKNCVYLQLKRGTDRVTDRRTDGQASVYCVNRLQLAIKLQWCMGLKEVENSFRIIINRFQSVCKNDADRWTNGHGA